MVQRFNLPQIASHWSLCFGLWTPPKAPLKVDMPNSFTYLDHTYIEWHVVRCVSKIGFQKYMFRKRMDYVVKI